ncbi:MAG: hypothetical protein GDA54_01445 [Alphaproteobacteria bacterium GM7ARS4]|nr:hypothetical protein [Alphaproteobacteria bacterium GM7ARS4]
MRSLFANALLFVIMLSSCTLRYPDLNDVPAPPEEGMREQLLQQIKEQE